MTNQRRRPEQTQRRLAIQASSRRNRTNTPNRTQDNNWNQEIPQSAYGEAHSYEPSTSERYPTHAQQNDWPREHQFRNERYHDPDNARSRNRYNDAEYGHPHGGHHDSNEHYREDRFQEGFETDRYGYDSHYHQDSWETQDSYGQPRGRSELDKDLEAMGKVWSMLRQGAVRMLGEVGRQY